MKSIRYHRTASTKRHCHGDDGWDNHFVLWWLGFELFWCLYI